MRCNYTEKVAFSTILLLLLLVFLLVLYLLHLLFAIVPYMHLK
jgi:hypothetical protein